MKFYFKVVYTNIAKELDVDGFLTITDFIIKINEELRSHFNIHPFYAIEVVLGGNLFYGDPEMAPAITSSGELVQEKFANKHIMFYLRPVNPITEEFIRQSDYSRLPPITSQDEEAEANYL